MNSITAPVSIQSHYNAWTYAGDALDLLDNLPAASAHLVVTDPPYFIDGMGDDWNSTRLKTKAGKAKTVKSLPTGMKFSREQGKRFGTFMNEVSEKVMRVLKPGGFYISFSQARLYHHLAMAADNAGFEMRDMLGWTYDGQAKAFSQDHFVRKMKITLGEKQAIIATLGGRKTPQLKPMIEPMILAQKPREGTFIANWMAHGTGLIDITQSLDGKFPGQLMAVSKPDRAEKGEGNDHPTVKPVDLIDHLVKLFSTEGQIVLDPFMGSGSHGVAAVAAGRKFIGFERDHHYFDVANRRIADVAPLRPANLIDLWRPIKLGAPCPPIDLAG